MHSMPSSTALPFATPSRSPRSWGPATGRSLERPTETRTGSVTHGDDRRKLLELVDRLPEELAQVIRLCDIEGRAPVEAAAVVGISAGNVRVRLHRARAQLESLSQETVGDRT